MTIESRTIQEKPRRRWTTEWRWRATTATTVVEVSYAADTNDDAAGRPNNISVTKKWTGGAEHEDTLRFTREGAEALHHALGEALQWDGRTEKDVQLQHKEDVIAELRRQVEALARQLERQADQP